MRHPTEGVLRRLLDEPAGVAETDREHVSGCSRCLGGLAGMREDAAAVEEALAPGSGPVLDVAAAWRRLATAAPGAATAHGSALPRAARARAVLHRPVAAAVAAAVVLSGAGAAAAAGWLPIFRTEQIAPVTITQPDLVELPDLSAYGEVELVADPNVRQAPDATAAEEATGISVPMVTELPQGVTGEPVLHVGDQASAVFTFSAEKAAQAAAAAGEALPPPPPGLDGSRFRLVAGPGVAAVWSSTSGVPALVVGRAQAPTAYSSGIPFETARDYLLSLPGLPEDVASQLRSFSGDGTTLPLPLPADQVTSSTAEVAGAPATVLTSRDGAMSAVVWVDDGIVTAAAGSVSADEVLSVARGLR